MTSTLPVQQIMEGLVDHLRAIGLSESTVHSQFNRTLVLVKDIMDSGAVEVNRDEIEKALMRLED
ncbi:MAG: hypothetical protein LBK46_01040, partial [Oscillospiraceae bacterium]|nr:hypothetical protein [Oscillospiraceae bacterium]